MEELFYYILRALSKSEGLKYRKCNCPEDMSVLEGNITLLFNRQEINLLKKIVKDDLYDDSYYDDIMIMLNSIEENL